MRTPRRVVDEVAHDWMTTADVIIGRDRQMAMSAARAACALKLRDELKLSLSAIGAILGGRDHSSVLYLIRKARERAGIPEPPKLVIVKAPDPERCACGLVLPCTCQARRQAE